MVHPMHGSHQEHVPPRSEVELELRRYALDHSIKFLFARAFKPRHELLVHGSQTTQKLLVWRVPGRIWIWLRSSTKPVVERLAGIHNFLHHLAVTALGENQMAQ